MSEQKRIPRHVAIIMDGNGRWAAQHGLERFEGHIRGVESVRRAIQAATRHGVRYLTLYAFSTENWGRPAAEVDAPMELFCKSVINETPELAARGVRVRIIGDKSRFPEKSKNTTWIRSKTERLPGNALRCNWPSTTLPAAKSSMRCRVWHAVPQPASSLRKRFPSKRFPKRSIRRAVPTPTC